MGCLCNHFSVDDLKTPVKLFTGAAPSVMTPQPIGWCFTDILLKHLVVDICQFVFFQLLRFFAYQFELCLIIASADTMNVGVKHGMVEFPYDTFCTCQYRSVVMKEIYPVVDIHPMGLLVGEITYDKKLSSLLELYYPAEGVSHRNGYSPAPISASQDILPPFADVNAGIVGRLLYSQWGDRFERIALCL